MPRSPPAMNGDTRARLMFLRCGQSVEVCSSTPAPVTIMVECSGSTRCSQIEEAASAKAKPEPPAAMPPSSAPSQRIAMVSSGRPPNMPSAEIEDEGEHAQAERHVQRQRRDQAELGRLDQRIASQGQERVERICAIERGGERKKMQRQ